MLGPHASFDDEAGAATMRAVLATALALAVIAPVPANAGIFKSVRKADLEAWANVPVEALDLHSIFMTMPMVRTMTDSGIEIRNYVNSQDVASCVGSMSGSALGGFVDGVKFSRCSSGTVACNNIFYIKDRKVIEYAPTGNCFTDKRARPESRYLKLIGQ